MPLVFGAISHSSASRRLLLFKSEQARLQGVFITCQWTVWYSQRLCCSIRSGRPLTAYRLAAAGERIELRFTEKSWFYRLAHCLYDACQPFQLPQQSSTHNNWAISVTRIISSLVESTSWLHFVCFTNGLALSDLFFIHLSSHLFIVTTLVIRYSLTPSLQVERTPFKDLSFSL